MRYINVHDCYGKIHECPVYEVNEIDFDDIVAHTTIVNKKSDKYLNIPCAFDIETTNIKTETPYAFMYQWQFCIGDKVCFGRTWEEYQILLERMHNSVKHIPELKYVVYVHYLAFEFQFMYRFLKITSMFARTKNKPMYVRTAQGIEFRCSYILSNMSLSRFCQTSKNCIFWKKEGDIYDYKKIRTQKTQLTEYEEEYCYCDVRGLCECISSLMIDDTLATIPLTSTGYVRRDFRRAVLANNENKKLIKKLALNETTYEMCKETFRGGNTSSNTLYVGDIIENVKSFDIQSSYPTSMLMDKFPMTKFCKVTITSREKFDSYINRFACLFRVVMDDVHIKKMDIIPYIARSKCLEVKHGKLGNGRVLAASRLVMTLTDIDWKIIENQYNINGGMVVLDMYISEYGYLPLEFREELLAYFSGKCELKLELKEMENQGKADTEEYADIEYQYNKFKNRINASYGMMVTDITSPEITFNMNSMDTPWEEHDVNTIEALDDYYNSYSSFLAYQWGVWVTANARARLQNALNIIGRDTIYIDTDSIKYINNHDEDFKRLNEEHRAKMLECDLDIIVDVNGKKFYIGEWELDGVYEKFKTLGSKKYIYETNGEAHLTLAGVNKKRGSKWFSEVHAREFLGEEGEIYTEENLSGCDAFERNLIIPNEISGRTTAYYNYDEIHKITVNGDTFTTASNIAVIDTEYTLGVTDEYEILIREIRHTI